MARTLRLIFALVVALIGGVLIAPPAHAAGTNTVIYHVTDPDGAPIAFTGWIYRRQRRRQQRHRRPHLEQRGRR